jgi:hypothetical protein
MVAPGRTSFDAGARFNTTDSIAHCGVYAPFTATFPDDTVDLVTEADEAGVDMALSRAYGEDRLPLTSIIDADVQGNGAQLRFVSTS